MEDSVGSPKNGNDTQQRAVQKTYFPWWFLVVAGLGAFLIYLFQRGTPVDQALSNAVTMLTLVAVSGLYVTWLVWRGPVSAAVKRLIVWGGVLSVVVFFSLIRITGVTGGLMIEWSWRWESLPDQGLVSVSDEIVVGPVDLKSLGDRLDFPGFLGKDRHPFVAADWEDEPNSENVIELWRRDIGAGWSGFAAVGGFGVTMEQRGDEESVSCYDLHSGEIRWAHVTKFRHETLLGGVGPRATPTIYRCDVYSLGPNGNLLCLAGKTGELIWQQDILELVNSSAEEDPKVVGWGRSTSPLVVDDLVIVPGGGRVGGPFVSLLAFDRKSGELVWKGGAEQISFSSPMLHVIGGKRQVVVVNESSVAGHDIRTGEQIWIHGWEGSSTTSANTSQPFVAGEDLVFAAKGYGQGATMFRVEGGNTHEVWRNPAIARTKYTNAALVDGKIYSLSDGILECAELATGERLWKKGRFEHGQLLMVGELILVQAEEGTLHILRPHDRGFDELYSVQAMEDRCWATMTLYDNMLIMRNSEEAVCYQLPIKRL